MIHEWITKLPTLSISTGLLEQGFNFIISVSKDHLLDLTQEIWNQGYHVEDVTVVEYEEFFQVSYHYARFDNGERIKVKCNADLENPIVPSTSHIFSGANWHERECHDFYGVRFQNHPNLLPLLLPEDMTSHPLLKEEGQRKSVHQVLPFEQQITTDLSDSTNNK